MRVLRSIKRSTLRLLFSQLKLRSTFHRCREYLLSRISALHRPVPLFERLLIQGAMVRFTSAARNALLSYPLSAPSRLGLPIFPLIDMRSMVLKAKCWSFRFAFPQMMERKFPCPSMAILRFSPLIRCFPEYPQCFLPPFLTSRLMRQGIRSANADSSCDAPVLSGK